jgi:hypothetical protein
VGAEGTTVLGGFESITRWILKGNKIGPISFKWQDHEGWLYAFVVSAFNKGQLQQDKLVQTTVKVGLNNVVDAFWFKLPEGSQAG